MIERQWGGGDKYLWKRWNGLIDSLKPSYPGEPIFMSAGIWTKMIGPVWASLGGIALDIGSVMDYFKGDPKRPAVLATRYGKFNTVPDRLSVEKQLETNRALEKFI